MMSLAYKLGWGYFAHTASNGEVPPKPLLYPGNVWKCFHVFGKRARPEGGAGGGGVCDCCRPTAAQPTKAPRRDPRARANQDVVSGVCRRREPARQAESGATRN
jgi:hypothetical protein